MQRKINKQKIPCVVKNRHAMHNVIINYMQYLVTIQTNKKKCSLGKYRMKFDQTSRLFLEKRWRQASLNFVPLLVLPNPTNNGIE